MAPVTDANLTDTCYSQKRVILEKELLSHSHKVPIALLTTYTFPTPSRFLSILTAHLLSHSQMLDARQQYLA